jgi:hypothetical protein
LETVQLAFCSAEHAAPGISAAIEGSRPHDGANQKGHPDKAESMEREMMMKALFLCVAIGTCAAISLGASAANAQSVKPKYPREIVAASDRIAQRNEDCRRQAREQHLHLVKRYRFIRDCKRQ